MTRGPKESHLLLRYSTGAAVVAMPGHSARASFSQAELSSLGLPRSTYEVMRQCRARWLLCHGQQTTDNRQTDQLPGFPHPRQPTNRNLQPKN